MLRSFIFLSKSLTCRANSISVLVLGTEDCHLDHAQEDHASYPELDTQQVLPVARGPEEPEQSVQDVDNAHHHVELTGTKKTEDYMKRTSADKHRY